LREWDKTKKTAIDRAAGTRLNVHSTNSSVSSGWHDVVQGIATLDKEKFWKGGPSF
jgi:hypothetical protein